MVNIEKLTQIVELIYRLVEIFFWFCLSLPVGISCSEVCLFSWRIFRESDIPTDAIAAEVSWLLALKNDKPLQIRNWLLLINRFISCFKMIFAAVCYGVGMVFTGILMFGAVYHVSLMMELSWNVLWNTSICKHKF